MARKTKEEAERTYHALLDAAALLFIEQGVARTTLNDIARATGMTRGAIYWHFDNKEEVIKALWERDAGTLHHEFIDALTRADTVASGEGFRETIKTLLNAVTVDARLSQAVRIVFHCIEFTSEKTELQRFLFERRDQFYAALQQALHRLEEKGLLRPGLAPEVAASALWSYITGLIDTHLEPESLTADLQLHGDQLVDLFLDSILAPRHPLPGS